ncbi:hypothetical protein B0H14DRAFT_3852474 [Mycena olivaceomarginata]|nr:hypothetical protein B0H14DRAFT_3852474 [Mycena olivaceomarginata]
MAANPLASNTQLDEFDAIEDPFAHDDIDWAQVLDAPATTQSISPPSSSPEYFPNDPVDASYLAQLDLLESAAFTSSLGTSTVSSNTGPIVAPTTTSTTQLATTLFPPAVPISKSSSAVSTVSQSTAPRADETQTHTTTSTTQLATTLFPPAIPISTPSNAVSTVPQSTSLISDDTQTHTTAATIQLATLFPPAVPTSPRTSTKRPRAVYEDSINTPSRKTGTDASPQGGPSKRRKGIDTSQLILTEFGEELTCPICCDILVAAHLLNPCGHSFCGDCSWQWLMKNRNTGCPVCRTTLAATPMAPNISVDKMVDTHIQMLSEHSDPEWKIGGEKLAEFRGRQKKSLGRRSSGAAPVWVVISDDEDEGEEFEDETTDEEYDDNILDMVARGMYP